MGITISAAVRLIQALALIIAGLALLVWLIPAAPMTGDGQYYIQFVRNGLQHGASSWHERRLLGPLIVRALPLDAEDGFFVLTTVSLGVTALLTWLAARELLALTPTLSQGAREDRALVAIPLLFGTWVVAPNLREFGLVDPLAWAFVAGVWLATVRKQWWLAAVVASVGVVAKEVVVIAALAAAAASTTERKGIWLAIYVAAPALLMVVALTLLFPGSGSDALAYVLKWLRDGLFSNGVGRAVFLLFASFAALWLLLPRGWPSLPPHLKRAGVVYVLAAIALPFVGSPERMEEAIFPLVIGSVLLATRSWHVGLLWTFALASDVFVARVGGDARLPTLLAWTGLTIACALAVWAWFRPQPGFAWLPGRLRGTTARSP